MRKIILLITLVISGLGMLVVTLRVSNRMIYFGGIDLFIFSFGIMAWLPATLFLLFVIICFLQKRFHGFIPFVVSVLSLITTMLAILFVMQSFDNLALRF